jgi:hypothetical protein
VSACFSLYASIQRKAFTHTISLAGNDLKNGKTKKKILCALLNENTFFTGMRQ